MKCIKLSKNKLITLFLKRKLKPPKPNRKLRISTKIDQDVFEVSSIVEPDKEYIPGWSFANVEKKEKLNNLFKKF